jgi:mRNA interferase MazF
MTGPAPSSRWRSQVSLQRAGFPLTLELSDTKLPKKSWVKISQIRTLSTKRIGKKIASASAEELVSIIDGLNEIIGG